MWVKDSGLPDASASRTTVGSKLDQEKSHFQEHSGGRRDLQFLYKWNCDIWGRLGPGTPYWSTCTCTWTNVSSNNGHTCTAGAHYKPKLQNGHKSTAISEETGTKARYCAHSPARGWATPQPTNLPYLHPFTEPSCSPWRWSWVPDTCSLSLLHAAAWVPIKPCLNSSSGLINFCWLKSPRTQVTITLGASILIPWLPPHTCLSSSSHGLSIKTWQLIFIRANIQWGQVWWEPESFCSLISEPKCHHLCHILWVGRKSLCSAQTRGMGDHWGHLKGCLPQWSLKSKTYEISALFFLSSSSLKSACDP